MEVTKWPSRLDTQGHAVISDSDAHFLDGVGMRSFTFEAERPDFPGLKAALESRSVSSSLV